MSTAASTIIKFLEAKENGWHAISFLTLWQCVGEIEDNFEFWKKRGVDVAPFTMTMKRVRKTLKDRFDDSLTTPFERNEVVSHMESSDTTVLRWIDEKLSNTALRFEAGSKANILELITETKNAIREDTSLSEELRLFLLRVVSQAEQALSEYEVTGDFTLSDAMVRLSGAINIAKANSKKPGIWERVRDNLLYPVAAGIMTRAPFAALDVLQMFALGAAPEPTPGTQID